MVQVLVIDDEIELLEEIVDTLQFEGYDVIYAESGLSGIQAARDHQPDIIVCDVMMPDINGYEVLQELRSDSQTMTIPFIFLTARVSDRDRRTGMNLGADDYVTKPFETTNLVNAINTRLEKKRLFQLSRLRMFSHRLVQFQEAERRNLAHLLRDDLSIQLNSLKILLDVLQKRPLSEQTTLINNARRVLLEALDQLNNTSRRLWPAMLNHLGLLPALLSHFAQFTEETDIQVEFLHRGINIITDDHLKITVFRIVQEALSNVAKYAQVDSVLVRTWVEDSYLHLHIIDNGIGFDIDDALDSTDHTGLVGIEERVNALGGKITLLSANGKGAQVLCQFPLGVNSVTKHNVINTKFELPPVSNEYVDETRESLPSPIQPNQDISVFVIDNDDMFRWGLQATIENTSRYKVVGEAQRLQGGLPIIESISPDIVILGTLSDEEQGDFTPIHQITTRSPDSRIIVLSHFTEYTYAYGAIQNGAAGYILKSRISEELLKAFDEVITDGQYITEYIDSTGRIQTEAVETEHPLDTFTSLTRREREVFYLVLDGMTNKDIAAELIISPRTAETHRLNMMRKLGVKGQSELMRYAIEKKFWHP